MPLRSEANGDDTAERKRERERDWDDIPVNDSYTWQYAQGSILLLQQMPPNLRDRGIIDSECQRSAFVWFSVNSSPVAHLLFHRVLRSSISNRVSGTIQLLE